MRPLLTALLLPLALVAAGCRRPDSTLRGSALADTTLLGQDVRHLAGDALEGRRTGTPGNDSAAVYIARRFERLGLEAIVKGEGCDNRNGSGLSCAASYLQRLVTRPVGAVHAGLPAELPDRLIHRQLLFALEPRA